jgi:hypothetical protein
MWLSPLPSALACPEKDRARQRNYKRKAELTGDILLLFPFIPLPEFPLWASSSAGFGTSLPTSVVARKSKIACLHRSSCQLRYDYLLDFWLVYGLNHRCARRTPRASRNGYIESVKTRPKGSEFIVNHRHHQSLARYSSVVGRWTSGPRGEASESSH